MHPLKKEREAKKMKDQKKKKNLNRKGECLGWLISRWNTAEERLSDYAHINRKSESRKAKDQTLKETQNQICKNCG